MPKFSSNDHHFMRMALELATRIKGTTTPNPAVGAVVVNNGRIVGQGATAPWGGPHAEKAALTAAGKRARGGTLYVTLEPCCHYGKTAPCTDAIIAAGCKRVVMAIRDPNPLVAGKGSAALRRRGITVTTGLLRSEAAALNEDFFWAITRRRAFITLKLACTLDGRIADHWDKSKWITSPALRTTVHELRGAHAAIAVGKGTLRADNPKLTVRSGRNVTPARILFSSNVGIPTTSYFYRNAKRCRSIVVVRKATRQRMVIAKKSGIEYWYTGSDDPATSMRTFTEMAFKEHLISVFVEGGQRIASTLLEAGLVNRLYLFYGNRIFGNGKDGLLFDNGLPVNGCITLKNRQTVVAGNEMYITGIPDNLR